MVESTQAAALNVRILSGGQTGVDRAALDSAMSLGFRCGGWCPRGRRAEDGRISSRYPLRETPSEDYEQRTEWNVRDADGTLIIGRGEPTGGTALTIELAKKVRKPLLLRDLDDEQDVNSVRAWISQHRLRSLNIAGPRESTAPGIYDDAMTLLREVLTG